jgi:reductive dehalogenase
MKEKESSGANLLERALEPFEEKLTTQEEFRRRLGVKQVDRPTYDRYITGPIEKIDSRRNLFLRDRRENPFADGFPERFQERTGFDSYRDEIPLAQLDREERIAFSLHKATQRICREYEPHPVPLTPLEGRVEVESPEKMSRLLKKVALFYGADLVGITELDPRWVYADKQVPEKFAVVVGVTHALTFCETAPSYVSGVAVADVYSRLKSICTQLNDFIRYLGYPAFYRETLGMNPDILMVPIALDAGIGEFARTCGVLTPEFGIDLRIKAVTTDLPLAVDRPISFGAHEFCMVCEICAQNCPARAIPFGPPTDPPASVSHNPGFCKWFIQAEKCLTFWGINKKKWTQCGARCIASCPWNKPRNIWHNTVRWLAVHGGNKVKKMLVKGDELFYKRKPQ